MRRHRVSEKPKSGFYLIAPPGTYKRNYQFTNSVQRNQIKKKKQTYKYTKLQFNMEEKEGKTLLLLERLTGVIRLKVQS